MSHALSKVPSVAVTPPSFTPESLAAQYEKEADDLRRKADDLNQQANELRKKADEYRREAAAHKEPGGPMLPRFTLMAAFGPRHACFCFEEDIKLIQGISDKAEICQAIKSKYPWLDRLLPDKMQIESHENGVRVICNPPFAKDEEAAYKAATVALDENCDRLNAPSKKQPADLNEQANELLKQAREYRQQAKVQDATQHEKDAIDLRLQAAAPALPAASPWNLRFRWYSSDAGNINIGVHVAMQDISISDLRVAVYSAIKASNPWFDLLTVDQVNLCHRQGRVLLSGTLRTAIGERNISDLISVVMRPPTYATDMNAALRIKNAVAEKNPNAQKMLDAYLKKSKTLTGTTASPAAGVSSTPVPTPAPTTVKQRP
jgi:hypothetical protein